MIETKYFIGLDVHVKCTQYAVRTWQGDLVLEGKCSTTYIDVKAVLEPYYGSCVVGMEACSAFYPLREGFLQDHVQVKIANVLRIRQLIVKNDVVDARRLSDMLRLNTFPESFIPPKEIQTLRDLVGVRHSFLEEFCRVKNRIWATLTRHGIRIPKRSLFTKKGWNHVIALLSTPQCPAALPNLTQHYTNVQTSLAQATTHLTAYTNQQFPKENATLQSLDGIAAICSAYLIANICPVTRFSNEKKLRRYAGVIPCFHESGGKSFGSTLPKTSSRALLRWALTMAAHGAIRKKRVNPFPVLPSQKEKRQTKSNHGHRQITLRQNPPITLTYV